MSPPLIFHIATASIAMLGGVAATILRKETFGFKALNSLSHLKDGEDASGYFFFGAIAVLGARLDLRLFFAGIGNKHRIARLLWRMSLAMAIGNISVTPRLNRLAGHPIQSDALLVAPTLAVLLFMVFWLWRVLRSNTKK